MTDEQYKKASELKSEIYELEKHLRAILNTSNSKFKDLDREFNLVDVSERVTAIYTSNDSDSAKNNENKNAGISIYKGSQYFQYSSDRIITLNKEFLPASLPSFIFMYVINVLHKLETLKKKLAEL